MTISPSIQTRFNDQDQDGSPGCVGKTSNAECPAAISTAPSTHNEPSPNNFGRQVDGARLKTGRGGVLSNRVDDEQIYDKTKASTSTASSRTSNPGSDP